MEKRDGNKHCQTEFHYSKIIFEKNPVDTTNNKINFLNTLSEEGLRTTGIKDRIIVITWARMVLGRHHNIETVKEKVDIMQHQVKIFKGSFVSLFHEVFPSFWEEDGKNLSRVEYQATVS